MREVSFGADGEVSPEGFETRYTTELANEYGNLASRTLAMIEPLPRRRRARGRAARRAGAGVRRPGRGACAARIDEVELTAALDEIWQPDQAPQPLRAGRGALEARQGRCARRSGSTRCSTRSPRACAWSRCCCTPFMPDSAERLLAALGREDLVARRARLGAVGGGAKVGELGQLFPQGRGRGARRLRRRP